MKDIFIYLFIIEAICVTMKSVDLKGTVWSVQFSPSVMSNSFWPHGLQHARPPCPSPTPGVYSNSCPLSRWCPSNHLILCHSLLLPPSIIPSIRVFSNDSVLCIRWPKRRLGFTKNWTDSKEFPQTFPSVFVINMLPKGVHLLQFMNQYWWVLFIVKDRVLSLCCTYCGFWQNT